MRYTIICSKCSRKARDLMRYKCVCGQPLILKHNLDFDVKQIRRKDYTVWRYATAFPYVKETEIVTLGEGWTPLTRFTDNLHFKLENLNPTGSFKDRGATVLISSLHRLVRKVGGFISEDSSGNAGASMAAYAARAGLKTKIYVPSDISGPKFTQIQFYGAEVVKVSGERLKVTQEAQKHEKGKFYLGHILHPLFREGIRSLAYEIVEQLGWRVPERIYLPVSAGTLVLGMINGFRYLLESDVTGTIPKIVACQTERVSPVYHSFKRLSYSPAAPIASIADALVSTDPPLLELTVKALREADGDAAIVGEDEIFDGLTELALKGYYVEPSSAVAYAAYKKQLREGEVQREDEIVIVLTGSGLKSTLEPRSLPL